MKKNTSIYYIGIMIITIKVILTSSQLIPMSSLIDNIFTVIAAACFAIKIMSQKYQKNKLILIIFMGMLILVTSIICNEYVIFLSYLAIISIENVDIKKIIRLTMTTKIILIGLHIFIYLLNINNIDFKYYSVAGEVRHNFYIGNPNTIAGIIMWTIAEFIYLKYEKLKFKHYLVSIIILYILYEFTKSRTTAIASIILVILVYISKKGKGKIYIEISRFAIPILAITSITLSLFYYNIPNIDKIDDMLSRRVSLGKIAIDDYGLTLKPQKIDYTATVQYENKYRTKLVLDNMYIRFAVSYGLIFLIIFAILFVKKDKCITKKEAIFIILFAIVSFTESYTLNAILCFPLLFTGSKLFYKDKSLERYNAKE